MKKIYMTPEMDIMAAYAASLCDIISDGNYQDDSSEDGADQNW